MRLRVALLCLAVALAGTAAVAVAGDPGNPNLKGAKKQSGPYEPELRVNVAPDGKRNVFVQVKSTHDSTQLATITQGLAGEGNPSVDYTIKWFRGTNDVSHGVQTAGYEFNLKSGAKRLFRVKIKPKVADPTPFCLYSIVEVDEPSTGRTGPFIAVNGPINELCVA